MQKQTAFLLNIERMPCAPTHSFAGSLLAFSSYYRQRLARQGKLGDVGSAQDNAPQEETGCGHCQCLHIVIF